MVSLDERLNNIFTKVSACIAAEEAFEFISCLKKGGSFEECYGIYKVSPFPPPGDPYFNELLNKLSVKERIIALQNMKKLYLERAKEIDNELMKIK